ncbi:hypothetical protein ACXO4M_03435 [Lactobacillus delbrueckii subsp. bulgaricus]
MHYQMCLDSLAAGKNVICEKSPSSSRLKKP